MLSVISHVMVFHMLHLYIQCLLMCHVNVYIIDHINTMIWYYMHTFSHCTVYIFYLCIKNRKHHVSHHSAEVKCQLGDVAFQAALGAPCVAAASLGQVQLGTNLLGDSESQNGRGRGCLGVSGKTSGKTGKHTQTHTNKNTHTQTYIYIYT